MCSTVPDISNFISEYLKEIKFESQFGTNSSNSDVLNTANITNSDCKNNVSNELYLAYLPHGSFHEQRISLENAIFLAWATNRTLIIPSIIFGEQLLPNKPFKNLSEILVNLKHYNDTNSECEWDSKHNHCIKKVQKDLYTSVKWEFLMDMGFSQEKIRSIHRETYNFTNLLLFLNITDQNNKFYMIDDEEIYSHQIYDVDEKFPSDTRYKNMIHLCSLQRRNETLLHFGSLFGTNRLNLKLNDNMEFLRNIRNNLIINHPLLLEKGEEISIQLGGLASYIGVHIEQLDDIIGNKEETFIDDVIEKLKNQLGIIPQETNSNTPDRMELASRGFQPTLTQMLAEECVQNSSPEKRHYPIIYLATDLTKSDPKLTRFFEEFPCIFMLSNFTDWTTTLKFIVNPIDNVSLYKFLVPLIDAIVVAKGGEFFGKNESLASNYIQRLHDYWIGS
ncbi:4416_t:CDS:2 [Cetraspora pellucida]|uniref:4416_t:CDS:1 n=1 Tax=Cetraspora pellucida TaxID=1433469 RepID=A0A9N9J001_9GLOM|nr:4416_t:CDS:2 [Cetraspora pellucida]